MADDSMEISSDHGHIADDDIDIDIDIDFSAVDGDGDNIGEDYMVDDTPLENGFGGGDTSVDQALHATDQVDFMLEDVAMFDEATGELKKPEEGLLLDVSISMHDGSFEQQQDHPTNLRNSSIPMDGAGYLASGPIPDAPMSSADQLTESFDEGHDAPLNSANDTLVNNQDSDNFDAPTQATTTGQRSSAFEIDDLHHGVQADAVEQPAPPKQGQLTHSERITQTASLTGESAAASDVNVKLAPDESAKTVPADISIQSPKESLELKDEGLSVEQEIQSYDAPRSPSTSAQEDNVPGHTSHDQDGPINEDAVDTSSLATSPDVIVIWKDIEYALFAKSEFDDPNTCFLFDLKILHKPLNALLKSMRDIIHDDLTDDDELCVNVTDIGLEFEETSAYISQYTVGQIIDLFHKLLENGGDSIRPLYMHVGVRTHFAKLYASCLSGANDGKILRDVVKTIEESESPNEYSQELELAEDQTLEAGEGDGQEAHEDEKEDTVDHANDNSASEPVPPMEYPGEYDHTNKSDQTQIQTYNLKSDNNTVLQVFENGATDNIEEAKEYPNGTTINNKAMSHVEEEEDLIDYSEDEFEMSAKQDGEKLHATNLEHENDPEQNGKKPDSTGEKLEESPNSKNHESSVPQKEENHEFEAEFFGDANGENEEGEAEFENETANEGQDYRTDEYDSITQEEYLDENVDHPEDQELPIEGIATNPNHPVDANVPGAEIGLDDDELNFEEDIDFGTDTNDRFEVKADDKASQQNNDRELYDTTGGVEFADPADSSATVSAGEPHAHGDLDEYEFQDLGETSKYEGELEEEIFDDNHAQHNVSHDVAANRSEDEIDYDDEDGKEEPSIEIQRVDLDNGSSKRPLSEVDADDATASRDQGHKRPRS